MTAPNPSLQKKTAARMAAVQCLYNNALNEETVSPAERIEALKARLKNNRDEQKLLAGIAVEPNYKLVETILSGIEKFSADINKRVDSALSAEWKRERMSPLLIAILECATFELFFDKDVNPKIIIDEYTRLTRSFFADSEVNFVHGALSKLATSHGRI